jgi:cytidine deaminase
MKDEELVKLAKESKERAYAPYSKFRVGAAAEAGSGRVYSGVNIENASYGATNCAERTAIFKAISEGEDSIRTIAIASDSNEYIFPCGICRQVISEFADSKTRILISKKDGGYKAFKIDELLPHAFKKLDDSLNRGE